jgi:hypothetical protein
MSDIFNVQGGLEGYQSVLGNASEDLIKAVIADSQTGRDYENTINTGAGLKVESLESTIKVLTNTEEHIKFWKLLNKKSIYNTVHEYNQQLDYGNDDGGFNLEGETPEFSDANYRRMSQLIKYMGFAGEVTLAAQLVKNADGKNNLARAIENKTALLMRFINKNLATSNSTMVPEEFDGLFQQHYEAAEVGNKNIDTYLASEGYFGYQTDVNHKSMKLLLDTGVFFEFFLLWIVFKITSFAFLLFSELVEASIILFISSRIIAPSKL